MKYQVDCRLLSFTNIQTLESEINKLISEVQVSDDRCTSQYDKLSTTKSKKVIWEVDGNLLSIQQNNNTHLFIQRMVQYLAD
jgi:hypothetical protein